MEHEVAEAKRRLRIRVRAARAARSGAGEGPVREIAAGLLASAHAAGLLDPQGRPGAAVGGTVVAAYLAMPGEPDPILLCQAVRSAGGSVLLPRPLPDRTMQWVLDDGSPAVPTEGRRVPVPAGASIGSGAVTLLERDVRVLLVPALAVDEKGHRLGQGGGYFDRLLADLAVTRESGAATPRLVAVVHAEEILDVGQIPLDKHDQPVDAALTPDGLRVFG